MPLHVARCNSFLHNQVVVSYSLNIYSVGVEERACFQERNNGIKGGFLSLSLFSSQPNLTKSTKCIIKLIYNRTEILYKIFVDSFNLKFKF